MIRRIPAYKKNILNFQSYTEYLSTYDVNQCICILIIDSTKIRHSLELPLLQVRASSREIHLRN